MTTFVDTSALSLALRRDGRGESPIVEHLTHLLRHDDGLASTGLVLQELLHGVVRPTTADRIVEHFAAMDVLQPTLTDHMHAADIRNRCRRAGVQLTTVDALLASLCIGHGLEMLTADLDFEHAAAVVPLQVWHP